MGPAAAGDRRRVARQHCRQGRNGESELFVDDD